VTSTRRTGFGAAESVRVGEAAESVGVGEEPESVGVGEEPESVRVGEELSLVVGDGEVVVVLPVGADGAGDGAASDGAASTIVTRATMPVPSPDSVVSHFHSSPARR
jgi:hypothetical protein